VVTPLGIFARRGPRLEVESIHPGVSPDAFRDATGFTIAVGPDTPVTLPPTPEELTVLRAIDPDGVVRSEFA
jgi:hypothetical protein